MYVQNMRAASSGYIHESRQLPPELIWLLASCNNRYSDRKLSSRSWCEGRCFEKIFCFLLRWLRAYCAWLSCGEGSACCCKFNSISQLVCICLQSLQASQLRADNAWHLHFQLYKPSWPDL